MATLSDAWEEVMSSSPTSLRASAESAAELIGLGGDWDAFVTLAPNRRLPWFAADDGGRPFLDDEVLAKFVAAHHRAALFGLVADRMADRQAARTPQLLGLRGLLLEAWQLALGEALGDRAAARRAIGGALQAWRCGIYHERHALAGTTLTGPDYASMVSLKLAWVRATAMALVERFSPGRATAFAEAGRWFLAGLQCRDDAVDNDEDARLCGSGVAAALGLPRAALFRAAPRLIARAASIARGSRFLRFATWLDDYRAEIDVGIDEGFGPQNEVAGWMLAESMS